MQLCYSEVTTVIKQKPEDCFSKKLKKQSEIGHSNVNALTITVAEFPHFRPLYDYTQIVVLIQQRFICFLKQHLWASKQNSYALFQRC